MNFKHASRDFNKNRQTFLLTLPGLLFLFVFCYLPMIGIYLAFIDFKVGIPLWQFWRFEWIGLKNFEFFFHSNDAFQVTRNTLLMNAAFIFFGLIVALAFALMLHEIGKRFLKIYQTVMFYPFFLSWVVVSYIFLALFDMQYGWINRTIAYFGFEAVNWYSEPAYWPFLLIIVSIWKGAGYSTLIYYSALLSIDKEYYEAAELDGAGKLQQIRYISIPFLTPLIIILLLLAIGRIFYADFGMFYLVTRDASALYPVTDVIDTYVYRALRGTGDLGMSTAAGTYQALIGFILVYASNRIVKKINTDHALF